MQLSACHLAWEIDKLLSMWHVNKGTLKLYIVYPKSVDSELQDIAT